jgi:Concanavalin A-like lectin/glucanases superfamily
MNLRRRSTLDTFAQYLVHNKILPTQVSVDDAIIGELAAILYSAQSQSSTRYLQALFTEAAISNMWNQKTNALLACFDRLIAEEKYSAATIHQLAQAVRSFVTSRSYEADFRYERSSYLGFHLTKTSAPFNVLISTLDTIIVKSAALQTAKPRPNSYNLSLVMSLLRNVTASLNSLKSHPLTAGLTLLLIQSKIIDAANVVQDLPQPDHVVAFYPFNQNGFDASDHNHDAINWNVTLVDDRHGNAFSAFHFDGISSRMIGNGHFPKHDRTFAAWFKLDSNSAAGLIGYGGELGNCGTSFNVIINNKCNTLSNTFEVQAGCDVNRVIYVDNNVRDLSNTWTHITITTKQYEGTKIYLNGTLVKHDQNINFNNTYVDGAEFTFGATAGPNGTSNWSDECHGNFPGTMDQIVILDIALEQGEVNQVMNIDNPAPAEPDAGFLKDEINKYLVADIAISIGTIVGFGLSIFACHKRDRNRANSAIHLNGGAMNNAELALAQINPR